MEAVRHLALVGTTASGKSQVALEVARRLGDVEIVSVDSMQVYRGMDIGTAKPTPEERADVAHHLLDVADPSEDYSVARFQADAREAIAAIESRSHRALLVGGTGLYVRALVDGLTVPPRYDAVRAELEQEPDTAVLHARLAVLDPVAAGRMLAGNRRRVVRALEVTLGSGRPFSSFGPGLADHGRTSFRMVGIRLPSPVVADRIEARVHAMVAAGLVEEVRGLALADPPLSRTARQALGYREILEHLAGRTALEGAVAETVRRTRSFARRQRAWFRRDPRITWLDATNPVDVVEPLLGDWAECR